VGVLLAWLTIVPATRAEPEASPFVRSGFYAGLGGFYIFEDLALDAEKLGLAAVLSADPAYDNSAGAEIVLGYRAHPKLGLEFVYQFIEGFDSTAGSPATEIDGHAFTLNAHVYPCGGRLQPYGSFGLGAVLANSEVLSSGFKKPFEQDLGFALRFGAGLDYYLTEHVVFGLEGSYVAPVGGLAGHVNFGAVGFRFLYRL
jgi:opacity protein-like surface antigen